MANVCNFCQGDQTLKHPRDLSICLLIKPLLDHTIENKAHRWMANIRMLKFYVTIFFN